MRILIYILPFLLVLVSCNETISEKKASENESNSLPPNEGDTVLRNGYYRYTDTFRTQHGSYKFVVNLPIEYDSLIFNEKSAHQKLFQRRTLSKQDYTTPCQIGNGCWDFCKMNRKTDSLKYIAYQIKKLKQPYPVDDSLMMYRKTIVNKTLYASGKDSIQFIKILNYNGNKVLQYFVQDTSLGDNLKSLDLYHHLIIDHYKLHIDLMYLGRKKVKMPTEFETISKSIRFKKL